MRELLAALAERSELERYLAVGALALARFVPVVLLAPFFAARSMPAVARTGLALGLVILVLPAAVSATPALPRDTLLLGLLALREAIVGTVLAWFVAVPFLALEAAGRLVDTLRGARMGEVLASPTDVQASPLGAFLLLYGVVLFFLVDGPVQVTAALAESYRVLPLASGLSAPVPAGLARAAIALGGQLFVVALAIAAPVVATVVLLELALGLAGRLAPQLPTYFLGLPLKALSGIAVLLASLAALAGVLGGVYRLSLRGIEVGLTVLGAR